MRLGSSLIIRIFLHLGLFFISWEYSYTLSQRGLTEDNKQLLLLISDSWQATSGRLFLFERDEQMQWHKVDKSIKVSLGRNGMGWGKEFAKDLMGRVSIGFEGYKEEGDEKSPAGIYPLKKAFGHVPKRYLGKLKFSYLAIKPNHVVVEDPNSRYYNRIIDEGQVVCDWTSSKKMGHEPLYLRGVIIGYNSVRPKYRLGSAIFLHVWQADSYPTKGGTAMSFEDISKIIKWLDSRSNPVIVQLPRRTYLDIKNHWNLPDLDTSGFSHQEDKTASANP